MKRTVLASIAALLAIGALPASAAGGKKQTVTGSIVAMARHTEPTSCYPGLHRRINVIGQESVQGVVGYHFDIDKKTWNKPFVLEPTGGQGVQGEVDLNITFYTEFGTVEQATDTAYAPPTYAFEHVAPGGESGKVPKEMNRAIVCAFDGANVTFEYVAGAGVKVKK